MSIHEPLFINVDSHLADTTYLTTLQQGAYLLMLIAEWRTPDRLLRNDDTYLARITKMNKRTWAANRDVLLELWDMVGDEHVSN